MDQIFTATIQGEERFVQTREGSRIRALLHPSSSASPLRFLLIHGNPASLEDWDGLVPLLTAAGDVLRIDLPGFGQSTRPPQENSSDLALPRLADCVLAVADDFKWTDPFIVVGHSHGGGVAQVLAAEHSDRIQGVVLLGTLAFPTHLSYRLLSLPGVRWLMKFGARLLRRHGLTWAKRLLVGQVLKGIYAPQRASGAQVEKEMARLMRSPDSLLSMVDVSRGEPSLLLKQLAPQIRCKILIVHGENDAVVPVRCARSLYATLSPDHPGARLRVLPGAGHMLALYQADQCARLIVDFAS